MRRVIVGCLGLLWLSCSSAPPFQSRRLADGSYELACSISLPECLDRVDQVCGGTPYDVIAAHDHRRPIDIRMGSYQNEIRSSEATIRCSRTKPLFGGGSEPTNPAPPVVKSSACVPGATQVCVGIGACAGGQFCLADGSGFGPCTCAPAPRAADGGVD